MQEPARRDGLAFVKTFPIDPGARAILALDAKIIARQRASAIVSPPFHGDAFRSLRMRHLMHDAPPFEPHGRTVWHFGDCLDRLRPRKQTDRTDRSEAVLFDHLEAEISGHFHRMGRYGRNREFGNMVILRNQADHAAKPEARSQSIDEVRELRFMIWNRKACLLRIAAFYDRRGKTNDVEAETGIASISNCGQFLGEQTAQARRIPYWRAGADFNPMDLAIGAKQRGLQKTRAFAAPLQQAVKLARKMLDRAEHIMFKRDWLGETPLDDIGRYRELWCDRFILMSQRLIDAADQLLPETRDKRRTRAVEHVGNAFETNLTERIEDLWCQAQGRER